MEPIMLSLLVPTLETNCRFDLCEVLGATDACEASGGIGRVAITFSGRLQPCDLCEGPAEHVYLKLPYSALDADM